MQCSILAGVLEQKEGICEEIREIETKSGVLFIVVGKQDLSVLSLKPFWNLELLKMKNN